MPNKNKNKQTKQKAQRPKQQRAKPQRVREVIIRAPKVKPFSQRTLSDHVDSLADNMSKFLGFGKYELTQNNLFNRDISPNNVPFMHTANEGMRISHREYISDIVTSPTANTFLAQQFNINPGLDNTFPWLSGVARQFQEYEFNGLIFEFVSTSGDALNSVNTALGSVIGSVDYRSDSLTPLISKQSLLDQFWTYDTKPSQNMIIPVECDPRENPFQVQYVRGINNPPPNIQLYDLGLLTVATTGFQGTSVNAGELWVSYDVTLKKPRTTNEADLYGKASQVLATDYTNSNVLSLSATYVLNDNIGLVLGSRSIGFPTGTLGYYHFSIFWQGNTNATYTAPTMTPNGCSLVSGGLGDQTYLYSPNNTTISTYQANMQFVILFNQPGFVVPGVTFGTGATLPSGAIRMVCTITQIPPDIVGPI